MAAHDISDLTHLLSRGPALGSDPHPLILKVATGLFVARDNHSAQERAAFAALCAPLIATVDDATAQAAAATVCQRTDLPDAVLKALIARGGACAIWTLEHALHAKETVLCQAADLTDPEQACALARRAGLSTGFALILTEHPDPSVARTVCANSGIPLVQSLEAQLRERAKAEHAGRGRIESEEIQDEAAEPSLAELLASRHDLSPGQRAGLFLEVGPRMRQRIAHEISILARLDPVRRLRASEEDLADIDRAARESDAGIMTLTLTRLLRLPAGEAQSLIADASGEALAVALRAIDCPEELLVRVLIRLDPTLGASVERVFSLVTFFRSLETRAALRLIASFTSAAFGDGAFATFHHQLESDPAVRPERQTGLAAQATTSAERTRSLIERAIGRKG